MARAIGIDLGTTNSCAAIVVDDRPQVIPWPGGARTIPSVFAIDKSGKRITGEEAKAQSVENPENTITASKRLIGRSFDSEAVERMSQVFTYEIVEGQDSEVLVKVAGNLLTLEQVASAILVRIKENAERHLGEPVDAAVITVPAYFNDRQRQSVRTAGRLAGLNVLRVLNEPTAAALAYGLGHQFDHRVAIYDLGGGTFDVSIIDIKGKDKIFEVIATDGNTFLGGVDFDERVMQEVLKTFYLDHDIDLSYDRSAVTRIHDACERAKIRLSDVAETDIVLEKISKDESGNDVDLRFHLTRSDLEKLTTDLVERSIDTCTRVLREKNLSAKSIDELLLVGGQTRMPLVRQRVEQYFERPGSDKVQPDEAVALGAAIMANALASRAVTGEPSASDVTLEDVLPMRIGIGRPDGSMYVLFKKNEKLPLRRKRELTTSSDNQKSLVLRVFQGESDRTADNELLGGFVFHGLRQGPKGTVRIEVTFHIDSEGILKLDGRDKDTGEVVGVQIRLDQRDDERGRGNKPAQPLDLPQRPSFLDDLPEVDADEIEAVNPIRDAAPRDAAPRDAAPKDAVSKDAMSKDASKADAKAPERPADKPAAEPPAEKAESKPAEPEPQPAPGPVGIDNLRQVTRKATPAPEEPKSTGFFGWLKKLFGLS